MRHPNETNHFRFGSTILNLSAKLKHQINDNDDVENQQDQSRCADMSGDLVHFKWNKGGRSKNRKVFSPALAEKKPGALRQQERGVKEGAHAELFKLASVKAQEFFQQAVNEVIIGIDAKYIRPAFDLETQVLV